jgi:hypothetical protein
VLAGIIVMQAVLYGPSLIGRKVLLPLDILAGPGVYLPRSHETAKIEIQDQLRGDWIYMAEPARRFAASELMAGRLPMWAPYQFAGAPFIWPRFSPILAFEYLSPSPRVLAWGQLASALIAGLGAYAFFRRVIGVGFWPAAICGWCFPMTGFLVFWQGYPISLPVIWLPWELLAVDGCVRGENRFSPLLLAIATCLVWVSGQLDIAGQVLIAAGLFGGWRTLDICCRPWSERRARQALVPLGIGCVLGTLLAAPHILPITEYAKTGVRLERRGAGAEERPPVGLRALPQVVMPDMYGTDRAGSHRLTKENQIESSAAAYTGAAAALLLVPLAWSSRRFRPANVFWSILALLSLSWCLNVPGLVGLLRLPGLNLMSHNRLVFIYSFAALTLAAAGLEVLKMEPLRWRQWFWIPALLLAGLGLWSLVRVWVPPEPLASQFEKAILRGEHIGWTRDLIGVKRIQAAFAGHYANGAAWCLLGVIGWGLVWLRRASPARLVPILGLFMVADLLWFAHGRYVQCDPALYYPRLPALEQVSQAAPGRVIGSYCLPPNVGALSGLRDVRGYDAVDPARMVELLLLAAEPDSYLSPYALSQWIKPRASFASDGSLQLSPVLNMLNVRYAIFRRSPPPGAKASYQGQDYWVATNPSAMPRAYVPRRVEVETEKRTRLRKLASADFSPRDLALVEEPVNLPAECSGKVEITTETPTRIQISVRMETPGLVVLADRWDRGWKAALGGREVPILITNHAIRGVIVPAGSSTLEFCYRPGSFRLGLGLCGLAAAILTGWAAWMRLRASKDHVTA